MIISRLLLAWVRCELHNIILGAKKSFIWLFHSKPPLLISEIHNRSKHMFACVPFEQYEILLLPKSEMMKSIEISFDFHHGVCVHFACGNRYFYKYGNWCVCAHGIIMKAILVFAAILVPALSARLPYIVGGHDSTPGKWPWQASLQYYSSHYFGASLISNRWLVTAAHCVGNSATAYTVILGAHDIKTKNKGSPQTYTISKITIHPDW